MENIKKDIMLPKTKERLNKLKQIKENLEKTNISNKEITKNLIDLIEFPDIISKEINVYFYI
jgi:hypothetical protein